VTIYYQMLCILYIVMLFCSEYVQVSAGAENNNEQLTWYVLY